MAAASCVCGHHYFEHFYTLGGRTRVAEVQYHGCGVWNCVCKKLEIKLKAD